MHKTFVAAGAAVLSGFVLADAPCAVRPEMAVPLATRLAIAVDGRADEAVWATAPAMTRLPEPGLYSPEGAQSRIRWLADAEALYLFCEFEILPSSSRPKVDYERDRMISSDIAEVFFKPGDADRQFHFMFDGRGNVYDATYTYDLTPGVADFTRTKRDSKWNMDGLAWKAVYGEKSWTLEVKFPWKGLGMSAPADGQRLRMNIAHSDYAAGVMHNQLTEWALQKSGNFAVWPDWGFFTLAADPVRVTDAEILKGAESVEVSLVGGKADADVKVVVEEMDDKGCLKTIGTKAARLAAGAREKVCVALSEQTCLSWITVFADGKVVYRRGGRPAGKILSIGRYDPDDKRGGRIFIPNDTDWYTPFGITHTLTGKTGNKVYGEPPELQARIVAEVPDGVSVTKIKYSDWGWDLPVRKPLSEETFTENGKTWRRYVLPAYISGVNRPLIFFRSTLPAGTTGSYRLYMTWKDGRQKPVDRPFRVVSFGRVKPFARMQMRMDDLTFNAADAICGDAPLATELPRLGINVFKIPLWPSKATMRYGKESYRQRLDRFVRDVEKSGLTWYFMNANDLNAIGCWANDFKDGCQNPYGLKADPEARFLDREGRPVRSQFAWMTICPSYRGTNFTAFVAETLKTEAFRDYGVSWAVLDWEFWDSAPCYCPRCRALFADWAKSRGLPDWGDPRAFMADEKANAEAAKAYRAFYLHQRGQMYVDLKDVMTRGLNRNRTVWRAPKPGVFVISDWIRPRPDTMAGVDFHDWPFAYHAPWQPKYGIDTSYDNVLCGVTKGSAKQVVCSLNAMQGCNFNAEFAPDVTWYNMLEAAAAGVQGFEWWYVPSFDAETWKYVMDGLRTIRPFEDIVMDGATSTNAREEGCTWRRVRLNGEALYCVRNYGLLTSKETKDATVTVDALLTGAVYDAVTGEKLADLRETGATTVRLTLSPENPVRLLYAGPRYKERQL